MKVGLHDKVPGEIREGMRWYDERSSGLGEEFFDSVRSAVDRIALRPRTYGFWQASRSVRRFPMERFPFDILFRILPGTIRILSVRHEKRHPSYGLHRK
jgi:plasmid stabilization system protein ParE